MIITQYESSDDSKFKRFICISECLLHNVDTGHLFQKTTITKTYRIFIIWVIYRLGKSYYFSGGSTVQFKTRKLFANIYFNENDFGIKAE